MTQSEHPRQLTVRFKGDTLEFDLDASQPIAVIMADEFETWIDGIADTRTNARITKDVNKMRRGLFGDWKEVGGVYEMRLDYGPGYRV